MRKLPKTQQELLDALDRGVPVYYMNGRYGRKSYWFRGDTFQSVTAAVDGLMNKGLAKSVGFGNDIKLIAVARDRAHA